MSLRCNSFLGPTANAEPVPRIQIALYASHVAVPKINFKIFRQNECLLCDQNFFTMLPSKHKTEPKFSISVPYFIVPTASSLPLILPSPFPTFLLFCQPICPRRTSGHCPRTFTPAKFLTPHSHGASHCIPLFFSPLSPSSSSKWLIWMYHLYSFKSKE
jgi:hypothetical protein